MNSVERESGHKVVRRMLIGRRSHVFRKVEVSVGSWSHLYRFKVEGGGRTGCFHHGERARRSFRGKEGGAAESRAERRRGRTRDARRGEGGRRGEEREEVDL